MYFAGIDLGSRSAKIAVMEDNNLIFHHIDDTSLGAARTARMIMDKALEATGMKLDDFSNIVATGYGRIVVPFASKSISDITAHVKGVHWLLPSARTIIELGGQDSKVMRTDERGRVLNFVMNDKCAAGNGRFLEIMADILEVPIYELGTLSQEAQKPISFSATCTIFIKSMALSLLRQGEARSDIVSGIHAALTNQVVKMLTLLGTPIEKDVVLCGGVAKNVGIVDKIGERIGVEPQVPEEPQLSGAIGAAMLARQRYLAEHKM